MNIKEFSPRSLPYFTQFRWTLIWNLIDSVGTQGLLILYHYLFRTLFGVLVHGAMGCTLSVFFLSVIICNGGLDASFAPFFETYTENRKSFKAFLLFILLPQLIFVSLCAALFYSSFVLLVNHIPLLAVLKEYTNFTVVGFMSMAFISESLRKSCRTFLQLAFYTRLTAIVELIGTACYIPFLITIAYLHLRMTLSLAWLALLILSLAQVGALLIGMIVFFIRLPTTHLKEKVSWRLFPRLFKTRFFAWSNQCVQQIFSGNFLVPVCALHFGIEQASLMKVISSISIWIMLISQKVFGISGNALLAHLKTRSLETQQQAFAFLSRILNQTLYFLLTFLIINGKKLAALQLAPATHVTWSLLYFMLLISFFESFFVLYEKWYIFEEKAQYYFFFNATSFGILYWSLPYLQSPLAILLFIILLRMSTFIALTLFSFYRWHIWPSLKPSFTTIVIALTLSVFFYVIMETYALRA